MAQDVVVNGTTYPDVETVVMIDKSGNAIPFYPDAVRYSAQTLTEVQKAQARKNIGVDTYVASELAKHGQNAPEYAESVEWLDENGDTSKMYVLPDGFIYAYMLTEVEVDAYTNLLPLATDTDRKTVYGGDYNGDGVNDGYIADNRLSSSGSLTEQTGMSVSGFIQAKVGDVLRIKGLTGMASKAAYVVSYNSANVKVNYKAFAQDSGSATIITPNAGFMSVAEDGTITFPLASTYFGEGFDAIRFSGVFDHNAIVTINEEIVAGGATETKYAWTNTGHAFVPADYEDRIIDIETQTAKNTADIANLKRGITATTAIKEWDAPIYDANIPVFELSAEKAAMTNATMTPDALYTLYDALMAKYPHYITKTDLGICSDGVNHVYRYDFKDPEQRHTNNRRSETKAKAIIVSGIHYEWAGMFGLYYALEEITENPVLRDLRRNVHLIVIPCSNPFVTLRDNIEASGGQQNANGVEVHRNFEVDFLYPDNAEYVAPGELHHGGTEPLSEVETQYIDNVLKENADAAFFMTCHNFNLDEYYGVSFLWPSVATAYMCNMGYRLIDKMSQAWMDKYGDELAPGIASYRTDMLESWDTRLGYAQISGSPGTETKQATKYGIQAANVEICERFHVHGTKENPEPKLSSFTMSRGAEVYVNFLLTAFGTYDPKDKALYR